MRRHRLHWHGAGLVPVTCAIALTLFPLVPSAASAQDAGPWWDFGIGAGWTHFTCDVCAEERDAGPVARLAFGGFASPRTRIGVEGTGWTRQDEEVDVREKLFSVLGIAVIQPSDRPLSLTGGLGWVGWRAEEFGYDALALKVSAGYAFDVGEDLLVENAISLTASSFGSLKNEGETAEEDVSLSLLTFTISVRAR